MVKELWEEIPGYPQYMVSNLGAVHNIKTGRPLKPRSNGRGYLRVALYKHQRVKDFYIHHLVAMMFLPEYEHGLQIRHDNGDLNNNAASNLRMQGGRLFREAVARGNGRARRVRIIETGEVFLSARDCAEYIGGDYGSVYLCLREGHRRHRGLHFEYYEE